MLQPLTNFWVNLPLTSLMFSFSILNHSCVQGIYICTPSSNGSTHLHNLVGLGLFRSQQKNRELFCPFSLGLKVPFFCLIWQQFIVHGVLSENAMCYWHNKMTGHFEHIKWLLLFFPWKLALEWSAKSEAISLKPLLLLIGPRKSRLGQIMCSQTFRDDGLCMQGSLILITLKLTPRLII